MPIKSKCSKTRSNTCSLNTFAIFGAAQSSFGINMSQNKNKQAYAERYYIEDNWTNKAIAATVGVSENTVGVWAKKYGWKEKKAELDAAPHRIKKKLLEEIQSVLEGKASTINSDSLSKLTRALERIDQRINVQLIITSFKEYDNWLASQDVDNEFLTQHLDYHKQYLQYRIENEH